MFFINLFQREVWQHAAAVVTIHVGHPHTTHQQTVMHHYQHGTAPAHQHPFQDLPIFGQPTRQVLAKSWNQAVDTAAQAVITWLSDGDTQQ